jgi:hypothetical protein
MINKIHKKIIEEKRIEQKVTYSLFKDGKFYIIENVPARVNPETGEQFFAPKIVDKIHKIILKNPKPFRIIETPVYEFVWSIYDERLKGEKHFIFKRLADKGDWEEVRWLRDTYGLDRVRTIVVESRSVSAKTKRFWECFGKEGWSMGMGIQIIFDKKIKEGDLKRICEEWFGRMAKAVVDVANGWVGIGGDLHADIEKILLEAGSSQKDLWGVNIFPFEPEEQRILYTALINIRPNQNNSSMEVTDPGIKQKIKSIIEERVLGSHEKLV